MPDGGQSATRESYGTLIDVITPAGDMRTFPGALLGMTESDPGVGAGADTRTRYADRSFKTTPAAANQEQKTLTLNMELQDHLLDYQDIVALKGSTSQIMVRQRREQLPVAATTSVGNTAEVTDQFALTLKGDVHPSSVPRKGFAIRIGGKNFVVADITIPSDAASSVDFDSAINLLSLALDRQGVTSGGEYKKRAEAVLAAAVSASVYELVWPKTATEFTAVRVVGGKRWGDWTGAEPGTGVTGDVVLEVVGDDLPFPRVQDLPVVN